MTPLGWGGPPKVEGGGTPRSGGRAGGEAWGLNEGGDDMLGVGGIPEGVCGDFGVWGGISGGPSPPTVLPPTSLSTRFLL